MEPTIDPNVCLTLGGGIVTIITGIITGASVLSNFLPNPTESTGIIKLLSNLVNWASVNIKVKTEK